MLAISGIMRRRTEWIGCCIALVAGFGCGGGASGGASADSVILSAYYGYDDCLGIADSNGDGSNADEAKAAGCRVVTASDGTLLTSAPTPLALALICAGQAGPEALQGLDGMPVVFSRQVVQSTVDPGDFEVMLSDGSTRTPVCATTAPANEENEDRTVLLIGDFGSPQPNGSEAARGPSPVELRVTGSIQLEDTDRSTGMPLDALGATYTGGFLDYRLGPEMLLAELAPFSSDGEGTVGPGLPNDCRTLFPDTTHVVRVTWSGGVSLDGVRPLTPDRGDIFDLRVLDPNGHLVGTGDPALGDSIRFLGLADLGSTVPDSPDHYVTDGDNVIDLCLSLAGDFDPRRIVSLATACDSASNVVYDPSGDAPCIPHAVAVTPPS